VQVAAVGAGLLCGVVASVSRAALIYEYWSIVPVAS
jgi:hypothetical protein